MKNILTTFALAILLIGCTPKEIDQKEKTCETVIAKEFRFTYYERVSTGAVTVRVVDWTEEAGSALPYRKDCQEINTYLYGQSYDFTTSSTTWHKREDRYVIRQK